MSLSSKIYKIRKHISDIETWASLSPKKILKRYIRKWLHKQAMKIINKI
jgi:hypothetical protein